MKPDRSYSRRAARERSRTAKLAYHVAIEAVIAGERFAAERTDDALATLNRAREALAQLGERGL